MPRSLARAARSAYEVVDRGLVLLALVWQALWILGDERLWATRQETTAASVALWCVAATWLLLLVWRLFDVPFLKWPTRWANVVALSAAGGAMLSEAVGATSLDWGAATSIVVLSACMAGLMLGPAAATAWVLSIMAVEAFVVLGVGNPSIASQSVTSDVLYPLYTLSLGAVMITARLVLTRDARQADRAAADLLDVERERLTAQGVESVLHRQERLLHETVLNTLTAIVRGGITGTSALRERLRGRCQESVDVLEQLGREGEDDAGHAHELRLDRDLRALLVEMHSLGVSVEADCDDLAGIPDDVYRAVRTATREALSNVMRHADALTVTLKARRLDDVGGLHVEVRDDGHGFPMSLKSTGFGIKDAMKQGLAEVGGCATIVSSPRQGTVVQLDWQPSRRETEPQPRRSLAAAAFAIPLLVSFGLFNVAVVLLTRDEVIDPVRSVLSLAIFLSLASLIAWASLRGTIAGWVVLVVALGSGVLYNVQTQAVADIHGAWGDWSSGAIVALFVVAAGAGPWWAWLVLLGSWLVIQGNVLQELLAAGTAMVISAALFGRNIRSNDRIVNDARAMQLNERTALAVAEEGTQRIRRRYEALDVSGARELLQGIADGSLDPDSEDVRQSAALEERYIRTVMRVDPAADGVHALAIDLAGAARARGLFLDVDMSPESAPDRMPSPGEELSLRWAIENSEPGGVARLSARREGGTYVLRLLTPIAQERRVQASSLPVRGLVLDPADSDTLWEIRELQGEDHDRRAAAAVDTAGDRR